MKWYILVISQKKVLVGKGMYSLHTMHEEQTDSIVNRKKLNCFSLFLFLLATMNIMVGEFTVTVPYVRVERLVGHPILSCLQ